MVILVETPIRTVVERYLDGGMTFLDLEEQFVSSAWEIATQEDSPLTTMVNAIFCLLVDYRDARITEDAFRAGLWRAIATDQSGEVMSQRTRPGSSATFDTYTLTGHSAGTQSGVGRA